MQSTFSSRGVWLQHLCVRNEQRLLPKTRQPAGGSRAPAGLAAEWPGWPSHGPQLGSSTGPYRLLHGRPVPAFGPGLTCERPARAPCVRSEPLGPSQTRPARPPSGPFVHFFLKGAFKMFSFAILFCLNRSLVIWGKCFLVTQRKPWKNVCWQCHGPSGGRGKGLAQTKRWPRVARRTSPRSLRSRGRRAPRAPEFPHGAFALFGEFRLNEEAGLR